MVGRFFRWKVSTGELKVTQRNRQKNKGTERKVRGRRRERERERVCVRALTTFLAS